ncbi:unnamed protein product [Orchesella dallaii]|uniref:G-protein coupled receptors family 2 profile 2 domain-containing protein n=1 Tax=Orchesella dallaii TaxID=48710 RepID=A0ABP1S4F5_9HEXA
MEINVCRQVITISKCCLIDFVYDLVSKKCVKLPSGRKPWVPTLCIGDHCSSASSFGKYEFVPPRFRYCSSLIPLQSFDLQSVSSAGYNLKPKNCSAKLELGSGVVELYYLHNDQSKKWQKHEGEYCADGLITNSSATYDPDLFQQQFIFKCEASKSGELGIPIYYWINFGALVYSSFILLIIIVVYLLLFDKQNFQGLLILSCCISMFFMHVLNVLGTFDVLYYFTTFSRFIKGNNIVCKTVAIGWHYFFLCNLAWFIMINYDLWRTVHPVHLIQPSRHFNKFLKYSLLAWGIPGVLVTVFTLTDTFWSEVLPTPGYGEATCFPKRSGMARFYISGPLITTLTINSFFAISIVVKLLKSSKESKLLTINSSERYTARFFLKLFCITGLAWLCPFVSVEVHQYNGGVDIAFLSYLVIATLVIQSTGMLVLLCFNERTLQQVSSKVPRADGNEN